MKHYSVFVTNRHTGERRLTIDGLSRKIADNHAKGLREIWPAPEFLGNGCWQGFDVTVEEETEQEFSDRTFTLHIHLGNDSMTSKEDIANALRTVASKLMTLPTPMGSIHDDNGNRVGEFCLMADA